ncbi:MAG: radical SAM family heme chaperone HemW [Lachnospiraceae bacterium]|nr:radical SAM family heme chaperone HemW [Lachnospiraceae bacterium]
MNNHKEGVREIAVYIHLPFCVRKCLYCDFISGCYSEEIQNSYVNKLLQEIDWFFAERKKKKSENIRISTIFFGGGTPSILPTNEINRILCKLKDNCELSSNAEISIEVNPGTVKLSDAGEENKFESYRRMGINRISIGMQSASDDELKTLGRIHTAEEFDETYRMAMKAGFDVINVDVMYALPGQNYASFEKSLRKVAALDPKPKHISAYSLIVEEGTPFYDTDFHALGKDLPDEDEERRMYEGAADILAEYGYEQYEISNYSLPGYECKHNCAYWTGKEYVGFGIAAASLIDDMRFTNTKSMEEYLNAPDYESLLTLQTDVEQLSETDLMSEFVILGLRMNRGVKDSEFFERFQLHLWEAYGGIIETHVGNGLLYRAEDGSISLTGEGRNLSNYVMKDFL